MTDEPGALRRRILGALVGPGRPEAVWDHYQREGGPLEAIDLDHMRELLRWQLQRADVRQEATVFIPRAIAELMLADLRARKAGKPLKRRRGAPRGSWWRRRQQEAAIEQVSERKAVLIAEGHSATDALAQALEDVAAMAVFSPTESWELSTLESALHHRARRRWK